MINKKESNLWDIILCDDFHQKHKSIESFRQIGGFNNRVTSWDAIETSSRYFKSLIYVFAENLDSRILQSKLSLDLKSDNKKNGDGIRHYLKNIRNLNLGNPLTINYFGNDVSIDYLLSTEEMFFIDEELKESKTILEIGAGFGRLAHSIIENFENVERYVIVDLDSVLTLSKLYLSKVLNKKEFLKIGISPFSRYPSVQL